MFIAWLMLIVCMPQRCNEVRTKTGIPSKGHFQEHRGQEAQNKRQYEECDAGKQKKRVVSDSFKRSEPPPYSATQRTE